MRFVTLISAGLLAGLLLAACSGPTFTVRVPDIEVPGGNSAERICYREVSETSPRKFASATYRATGTYSSLLDSDGVTIRVYGRTAAPQPACVTESNEDIRLSDDIPLPGNKPTDVEVGGIEYGAALAELISKPSYWIGARISDDSILDANEKIALEEGTIRVSLW